MKKYLLLLVFCTAISQLLAQSSIILSNGNVIPSMTQANRPASPTIGQLIYQTDGTTGLYIWNGTAWVAVSSGGNSGTVTNVSANAPISVTNASTTPTLSISQANGTTNGFISSADWSIFNNKFSLPSLTNGSILFSNGTTISENNGSLKWTNAIRRFDVSGLNDGTIGAGYANWISGNFGGSGGNRVVLGIQNGDATIGSHTNDLGNWAKLVINPGGTTAIGSLTGAGTRMVVANAIGEVSTQAIPTGNAGTVTNVSASLPLSVTNGASTPTIAISQAGASTNGYLSSTDWNTFNNKQNALSVANASTSGILTSADWTTFNNKQNALSTANGTTSGILTSTDWNTFNNKQNALPIANGTTSGILTSTDWTTFNNKQNALPIANGTSSGILSSSDWIFFVNKQNTLSNANGTTSGILSSTDWNIFNNKFSLPSLTAGSILFSNGTTISQNNSSFSWNNLLNRLNINGLNDGTAGAGFTNWISGNFGGSGGNRVVMGVQNGEATIAAHTNDLGNWAKLMINPGGVTAVGSLVGVGTRMVTANANGELSTTILPNNFTNGLSKLQTSIKLGGTLAEDTRLVLNSKKFSFKNAATTATLDQSLAQGVYLLLSNSIWQSITPAVSGNLQSLTLRCARYSGQDPFALNFTISIHAGEGTSGELLYQFTTVASVMAIGFTEEFNFPLNYPLALVSGQKYTIAVNTSSSVGFNADNNTYAGGLSGEGNGFDFFLKSFMFAETPTITVDNDKLAIGNISPTANLDIEGTFRLRNSSGVNKVLVSDASGNATWASNVTTTLNGAVQLNNNYISNNGSANGIRVDNSGNTAIGVVPSGNNKLEVSGTGGIKISSANTGSGSTDWIANNVGGTTGDRVVSGILNGKATIGSHTNGLTGWSDLVINNTSAVGATVTIGSNANAAPTSNAGSGSVSVKLIVNGSVRQGFYIVPVSVPANNIQTITWTHNLGYGPIVMMSTDQNGGGGYMDFCTVTTYNNDNNNTVFVIRNLGGNAASGNLRWILVW